MVTALACHPQAAHAETTVCTVFGLGGPGPVADTYLSSAAPTENFSKSDVLVLNDGDGVHAATSVALLRFDLGTVSPGAAVLSARLALHDRGNAHATPAVFPATTPWNAFDVTWNSFVIPPDPPAGDWIRVDRTLTLDVTPLASDWINLVRPNFGVVLASVDARFDSSRAGTPPQLTVCYIPATPTCTDGIQNQGEEDIDCGGPCAGCVPSPEDQIDSRDQTACMVNGVPVDPTSPACRTYLPQAAPFALFATGSITIGDRAVITGSVNALGRTRNPDSPALVLGSDVSVDTASLVVAPSVVLGPGSRVGAVVASSITGDGSYASLAPYHVPTPPLPFAAPPGSGESIVVHVRRPLEHGTFANVTVDAGATLELLGGEYVVGDLTLGAGATLLVAATSRVVSGHVVVGDRARVVPGGSSEALNLTLISGASDAAGAPAVAIGTNATVTAVISAPRGTVLANQGSMFGPIYAENITINAGAVAGGKLAAQRNALANACTYVAFDPLIPPLSVVVDDGNPCTWDYCDPSNGVACTSDAECPSSNTCASGFCLCLSDADCPAKACVSGVCQAIGVVNANMAEGASCSFHNGDPCLDSSGICVSGICEQGVTFPGGFPTQGAVLDAAALGSLGYFDLQVAVGRNWVWTGSGTQIAASQRNPDGSLALGSTTTFSIGPGPGTFLDRVFQPDPALGGLNINANDGFPTPGVLSCPFAVPGTYPHQTFGCPSWASNAYGLRTFEDTCINRAFDARVVYDCHRSRFLVSADVANSMNYPVVNAQQPKPFNYVTNWAAQQTYTLGPQTVVLNGGNLYAMTGSTNVLTPMQCTADVPGPSGNDANNPVNDGGTCLWTFIAPLVDGPCALWTAQQSKADLVRRQTVFGISQTEDPTHGIRYFWFPPEYADVQTIGLNGGYLSGTWQRSGNWDILVEPVSFPEPRTLLMLTPLEPLMDGSQPEGAIPDSVVFKYSALQLGFQEGAPAQQARFVPVVQRGVVDAADGKPEANAAFIIQQVANGGGNDPADSTAITKVRVWSFFPDPAQPGGRPLAGLTTIQAAPAAGMTKPPPIGTVVSAVIQRVAGHSTLHFLGCTLSGTDPINNICTSLSYGRVRIRTSHANGVPQLIPGPVELELQPITDISGGSSVTFANPSFDVTADGSAVISYSRDPDGGKVVVATTVLDPGLNVVAFVNHPGASPKPTGWPAQDFTGSARDPLFPWQVWFMQQATTPTGLHGFLGATAKVPPVQ